MKKQKSAVYLILFVLLFINPLHVFASSRQKKDPKREIQKMPSGRAVSITLHDRSVLQGWVGQKQEEAFELVSIKGQSGQTIPYTDVFEAKEKGFTGKHLFGVFGAAFAVLGIVLVVASRGDVVDY